MSCYTLGWKNPPTPAVVLQPRNPQDPIGIAIHFTATRACYEVEIKSDCFVEGTLKVFIVAKDQQPFFPVTLKRECGCGHAFTFTLTCRNFDKDQPDKLITTCTDTYDAVVVCDRDHQPIEVTATLRPPPPPPPSCPKVYANVSNNPCHEDGTAPGNTSRVWTTPSLTPGWSYNVLFRADLFRMT